MCGGGGQPVELEHCFIIFLIFNFLFAFVVGGLGFEFCVFVAGWRHALRSVALLLLLLYSSILVSQLYIPVLNMTPFFSEPGARHARREGSASFPSLTNVYFAGPVRAPIEARLARRAAVIIR